MRPLNGCFFVQSTGRQPFFVFRKGELMKTIWVRAGIVILLAAALLAAGCGGQQEADSYSSPVGQTELHVSAAASLTDAMKELAAEYEKAHPEVKIVFNFGSSGALQQAIQNGGESDLFSQRPRNRWMHWPKTV